MIAKDFNPQALLQSFEDFSIQADPLLHIQDNKDYKVALATMEFLFDKASDSGDDPINDLITLLAGAIGRYEAKQRDIRQYDIKAAELDDGVSTLKLLMDNHNLKISDFEKEIGKKSLVSMILNGKRNLTKEHIEKLSARFHVTPALFFKHGSIA
jgi:HTH-type transcriptional regulator/antitoxin HigA